MKKDRLRAFTVIFGFEREFKTEPSVAYVCTSGTMNFTSVAYDCTNRTTSTRVGLCTVGLLYHILRQTDSLPPIAAISGIIDTFKLVKKNFQRRELPYRELQPGTKVYVPLCRIVV